MARERETQDYWRASLAQRQGANDAALAHGGGDGHPPGMETEVALLKQRADQSDIRLARMEEKLDRISDQLGQVATKATVWTALGTGGGIALAIIALFVDILAYLQDERVASTSAPPPQPSFTLNMPAWPTPPASPAAPAVAPARP